GPGADPLVRGLDVLQDLLVRHLADRTVAADADDPGVRCATAGQQGPGHRLLLQCPSAPSAGSGAVSNSAAAARWSGVFSATRRTPGRLRLARPARVPPGHSSIRSVAPSRAKVSMHRFQRTGLATCATSRRTISAPSSTTWPSALETYRMVGS